MTENFQNKNQQFLYFNAKPDDAIPRRSIGKINVIDAKSIIDNSKGIPDPPRKKRKVPTPRDVLEDYLESTSVHGLQYFGKTDIEVGTLGKILWTCAIVTCFVCLSLMVMQFLRRYNENPTNTYIKTFDAPIFEAPFPAVTICSVTPISMRKRLAILENAIVPENTSREFLLNILKYGHHITHPYSQVTFRDLGKLKTFLDVNKWSVSQFLKILIPCEDIFESCWWSTERIDCSKSIKTSYTSYGLCCSFNYHLEDFMRSEKEQPKTKPLSSADFGRWSGLKLVLNNEMLVYNESDEHDSMKLTNSDGMMVLIHHSMNFPGLNTNTYMLQVGHELEIAINPELIQKPRGVQHRNEENQLVPVCIPEDENTLEYFPVYRYSNCYANCRVKAMIQICGCLPFTYDHISEFYNIERCELDRLPCIQENLKLVTIVKDIQNENITCLCKTPCENVNYDGYSNAISLMKTNSYTNEPEENAIIRVFMYSQTYKILITLPAADETYLLASIGGIFSLFLGCSFLSLVEIVYFAYLFCRACFLRDKGTIESKWTLDKISVNDRR